MKYNKTGFTLIELITVIAIIGFLASTAMYAMNQTRTKARDTQRIADLNQVRKALEMYYDEHKHYPAGSYDNSYTSPNNWIPELVTENFISKLPNDPKNNGIYPWQPSNTNYAYAYASFGDNQQYNLLTRLEDPSNPNRCAIKCYKFNTDNIGREGKPWCPGCGANSQTFSPQLYSDH